MIHSENMLDFIVLLQKQKSSRIQYIYIYSIGDFIRKLYCIYYEKVKY